MLAWFLLTLAVVALVHRHVMVMGTRDDYSEGAWRKSLDGEGSCWTDRTCERVLTTAHGGEWDLQNPYDSMPAFERAYNDGADAIKGGTRFFFRVLQACLNYTEP